MATDHAHHVVCEEVMSEGVRGGGGEERRLIHLHNTFAEYGTSFSGWSHRMRVGVVNIT